MFARVLVVEDADHRIRRIRECVPPTVRLLVATTGGQAIGVLNRDPPGTYQGFMLDHDLKELRNGDYRSGYDVACALARHGATDAPVLVHSMNPTGGDRIAELLRDNGFDVIRTGFAQLSNERLRDWFSELPDAS